MTIPEGAEGNDRPMTTVNETWRSPDLDINLLTVTKILARVREPTKLQTLIVLNPIRVCSRFGGYTLKDQNPAQPQ
jgi:hypothetical protein